MVISIAVHHNASPKVLIPPSGGCSKNKIPADPVKIISNVNTKIKPKPLEPRVDLVALMVRFSEVMILTKLTDLNALAALRTLNILNALKILSAGMNKESNVSQLCFRNSIFTGASMSLMKKSIIKIIQITTLTKSSKGVVFWANSRMIYTNHTNDNNTIGFSNTSSICARSSRRSFSSLVFTSVE